MEKEKRKTVNERAKNEIASVSMNAPAFRCISFEGGKDEKKREKTLPLSISFSRVFCSIAFWPNRTRETRAHNRPFAYPDKDGELRHLMRRWASSLIAVGLGNTESLLSLFHIKFNDKKLVKSCL